MGSKKLRLYASKALHDTKIAWDVKTLEETCQRYGFQYNVIGNEMFVKTAIAGWHFSIKRSSKPIKLYHENLLRYTSKTKFRNGYHQQDIVFRTPAEVVEYIYFHDKNRYRYMSRQPSGSDADRAV